MKKIFGLILVVVMCVSLTSCDFTSIFSGNNGSVELTVDNFKNYFDISFDVSKGEQRKCKFQNDFVYLYEGLKCDISLYGNPNYEYENVTVEIKFTHTGPEVLEHCAENTVSVSLNLAGNGSGSCYLETPVVKEIWDKISYYSNYYYGEERIFDTITYYTDYEIVSVTGTATKY